MTGRRAGQAAGWLLLVAALAGCEQTPIRVLLVGDSITAGAASAPPGPGYAALLGDLLGPGYEIVNVACSGSSSLDWRPDTRPAPCDEGGGSMPLYAQRARPALPADVAAILLGTNDLLGAFEPAPVEPDAYGQALRMLVGALHADGARAVVLMSPAFVYGAAERLAGYQSHIRALCSERPYVRCGPDLATLLEFEDSEMMKVHPNGSGHAKIAAALAETLREVADSD